MSKSALSQQKHLEISRVSHLKMAMAGLQHAANQRNSAMSGLAMVVPQLLRSIPQAGAAQFLHRKLPDPDIRCWRGSFSGWVQTLESTQGCTAQKLLNVRNLFLLLLPLSSFGALYCLINSQLISAGLTEEEPKSQGARLGLKPATSGRQL